MLKFDGIELTEDQQKALNEQVSGLIDDKVGGLKTKVDELLGEKKSAKAKADEAQIAAQKAAEESARKSGDVEALDKSWTEKYNTAKSEYDTKLESLQGNIRTDKVDSVAIRLAAELAGDKADGLLPHIKNRLDVELVDGKYQTIVKDLDGSRSALTVDELKAQIKETKYLAPLIIASNASGAGANGNKGNGGGAASDLKNISATDATARQAAIQKRLDARG